jgi:hypothetical protein
MRPNAVSSVAVYSRIATVTLSSGASRELPVDVLTQPVYWPRTEDERIVRPDDMLFTLADITDHFSETIDTWLRISNELDSVCNLFFSVQYRESYVEHEFMNAVQAVESYHRRRFKNASGRRGVPGRVKRIVESAPTEYQGVAEQLAFGNERVSSTACTRCYRSLASLLARWFKTQKRLPGKCETQGTTRRTMTRA